MKMDDLSAEELAALDSVCLRFEQQFGTDRQMSIEDAIKLYLTDHSSGADRERIELLREELGAIASELSARRLRDQGRREPATPFQPRGQDSGSSSDGASPSRNTSAASVDTQWLPASSDSGPLLHNPAVRPAASEKENSSDGRVPNSIGPYSVGRVLAKGGMGIVYRALDTRLDRPVAIKMIGFPHLASNDPKRIELVERFEREAKAIAALSHPNIVELFDVGVVGNTPYAVMEFLSGLTLADQLKLGSMSPEQTRHVGMQIAGALATAHSAGVIHRDLKPANVMLIDERQGDQDSAPRVKLVDFGLSRVNDSGLEQGPSSESGHTRSGMILGTPGYMAPEQARGESSTSAADMFGFGCVLYEVLYGRPAIPGDTPADRLATTLHGEVTYERKQCENGNLLCDVIRQCLRKDPAERPSATDVYARLRQQDSKPFIAAPDATPEHDEARGEGIARRHVLTTIAGGLLGGMLGGLTLGDSQTSLLKIHSLAVLTPTQAGTRRSTKPDGLPLADGNISEADTLASALVNELSTVDGLIVLPYRPLSAGTPSDYVELGKELGVDAFLVGDFENQTHGSKFFWVMRWQLVDANDGSVMYGDEFVQEQPGNNRRDQLLVRSSVASDVAKQIGRSLVTSGAGLMPPDPMAYGCMMKGNAYADADSTKGLKRALMCFNKAHQEDPRLAEPLASIAVASLNLAARSDQDEAHSYIAKATSSMTRALGIDPLSRDARLAQAMIEWQSLHHFDKALELIDQLADAYSYNAQVQYQRGLLLAAYGRGDEAIDSMRSAAKLNPLSLLIKTERCRIEWYFGFETRAVNDARRYLDTTTSGNPARPLALGLLVDISEHHGDWSGAAKLLGMEAAPASKEDYLAQRRTTLASLPYGPFGPILNESILQSRVTNGLATDALGALNESGATMFPLLLARHPAFEQLRNTDEARDFLPSSYTRPT